MKKIKIKKRACISNIISLYDKPWHVSYITGDSVVDHPLDCLKALPLIWDVEGLKDVREGGVVTADSSDRGLQVKEAFLL